MNAEFRVDVEKLDDRIHTLKVTGELDGATAPEFSELLMRAAEGDDSVLVDFTDCQFIDSTGLASLVEARERIGGNGRLFGLCCPNVQVRRLMKMTGIDRTMSLYESRDEALTALRA